MSTSASWFAPPPPGRTGSNSHVAAATSSKPLARLALLNGMTGRHATSPGGSGAANADDADTAQGLPDRIRRLIKLEGSAAAIADRCGFSAGAVRNWRDGHSDISRERCITMARALGVSLLWLVAGEGPMHASDESSRPVRLAPAAAVEQVASKPEPLSSPSPAAGVDPQLLAASLRLLQSYIGLLGGSLDQATRAGLLAELYGVLGHSPGAEQVDRLMTFHNKLNVNLRSNRGLIA
ncbi:YdaS family helix-turn-helix protein [Rhodanobacter sp. Root561]|uniref:helix-turn-helix domain-containing protein n=1 Tax=Rhodanobacter sp. Root561 TaxID=1736560 RepID=UPI0009EA0105|nr:YdaS family helix-turn-helix protein [Rhodanobacter sp. Root561]